MCGLVGMAGQITVKDEAVLRNLLVFDTVRGVDSTGIAVVSRQNDVKVAKALGHAFNLIDSLQFDAAMSGLNKIVIGHNRFATQGKVTTKNAHPFEIGSVVGAHNGTVKNKYSFFEGNKYDVDSQALYNHIDKKGLEDMVSIVDGAYALSWYDTEKDTLNFIRNEERPLHFAIDEKEEKVFWASERWMLSVALSRNDIKYSEITELPVDTHLSFSFSNNGGLEKPHAKEVKQPPKLVGFSQQHVVGTPVVKPNVVVPFPPAKADAGSPFQPGIEYSFEVFGSGVDGSNNKYYMLRSKLFPEQKVRLFRHRSDTVELMGRFIKAKLHAYAFSDRLGLYYKAEHSTVKLADIAEVTKSVVEENKGTDGQFFQDCNGKLIDSHSWNKKHGTCGWCTGYVNPKQNFKFTDSGDALCHLCADDKEVLAYVNVR